MGKGTAKGSVSIVLALTITMLLSFCMVLVESARENAMLLKAGMVFDTGIRCLMAGYHQKLWEEYDLLYIDSSYGENLPDYTLVKTHLNTYIEKNLQYDTGGYFALHYENSLLREVELASDFYGTDIYLQAVRTAEASTGIAYIEQALRWLEQVESTQHIRQQLLSDESQSREAIEEINGSLVEVEEAVWGKDAKGQPILISEAEYETVNIANPLDMILTSNLLLRQIVGNISQISVSRVEEDFLPSHRSLAAGSVSGEGTLEELEQEAEAAAEGLWKKALFCKYVLDHFDSYIDSVSNRDLQETLSEDLLSNPISSESANLVYPLEYLIGGKSSDAMNMEVVAAELLVIREIDNYLLLLQDEIKCAEAEAIGAAAAALVPWIAPFVSQGLLIYWAYEESIEDLQNLFRGEKVPLVKALNIEGASEFTLGYEDYLYILLLMQERKKLTLRTMDMMESDIREEQESFRIDGCISEAVLIGTFTDTYDKKYTIEDRLQYYEEAP